MSNVTEISIEKSIRAIEPNNKDIIIRKLHRELFYVSCFLAQENLLDEAFEFLEEHRNMPSPFESIAFVDFH
ncbi:MAG: hypothetical protein ACSW8K_08860 [bacterium]|jgi:hypothetical protein